MLHYMSEAARRGWGWIIEWFCRRAKECGRCRDCGVEVSPWDDYCGNCECGQPASVPISAGIALVLGCIVLSGLIVAVL